MPTPFSVGSFVDLIRLGVESNWFGLACPIHCGPPSATSLVLSFAAGLGLGLFLGACLFFILAFRLGFLLPLLGIGPALFFCEASCGASCCAGNNRIQAYLYE